MKRYLVAGIAAAAVLDAAAVVAADMPAKAPYTKAPITTPYEWTGFYLGVNVGLGIARNETTWAISGPGGDVGKSNLGPFGALGGAQIGYNWRWNNVVLGLETDFQGAGVSEDRYCGAGCVQFGNSVRIDQKLDWFGTARARLGLATGPVLSYVTGGFAYGSVKTTFTDDFGGTAQGTNSFSETRVGWTVGSGVEASLGGNWTGKLEYLLIDLGKQTGTFFDGTAPLSRTFSSDIREQVIRAGVNYRIGGNSAYAALPALNWAGGYVGANVGGGLARDRSSVNISGSVSADKLDLMPKGVIGGVQLGYNWQSANWVFGLETDIQGSSLKEDNNCGLSCDPTQFLTVKQTLPWLGTTRGRFGYSVGPSLFYVTGGAAYGGVKNQVTETFLGNSLSAEFTHTKGGWTAGAGMETPFDIFGLFGPNWTSKTEYLFVDLGSTVDTYTLAGRSHSIESRVQEHVFRGGLNYHFNTLVAR